MMEREWLTSNDAYWMTHWLWAESNERKIRLFAVACCRHIWRLIPHKAARRAVEVAERYADGLATREELDKANRNVPGGHNAHAIEAFNAVHQASLPEVHVRNFSAIPYKVSLAVGLHARPEIDAYDSRWADTVQPTIDGERVALCSLLRHIFGNPFRPYAAPDHWPADVVQLADALYHGADCGFALHDALLEAGHPELAEHVRQEATHPKGCWVVDLLLGKDTQD